jgi:hypothetical protein
VRTTRKLLRELRERAAKYRRQVEAVAGGIVAALLLTPPNSFSVDMTGLISYAEDIFNALVPAFIPIVGITLGVGLLMIVVNAIGKALKQRA